MSKIVTYIPRIDRLGYFEEYFQPEDVCNSDRQEFAIDNSKPDQIQIANLINELAASYGKRSDIRLFSIDLSKRNIINHGREIEGQMANHDEKLHADSVFSLALRYIKFVRDPRGAEYVQSPYRMLRMFCQTGEMYGDCDDHVLLVNSLLNSLGFKTKVVLVTVGEATEYNHVISKVFFSTTNKWIYFDACNKQNPFKSYDNVKHFETSTI